MATKRQYSKQSAKHSVKQSAKPSAKQSGGTFLGVVLGLIVGLAIAVVVALYITHTPTPFVSRNASAPSDASSAQGASGTFDPNRPLQGNSPGQPVPQATLPAPPNTAPGQPANRSSGLLDEPQIVEVPATGTAGGAGNNAAPTVTPGTSVAPGVPVVPPTVTSAASTPRANAASNATPAPSANDANTGFYLQVGAYKTQADAEQQRARLALQGFESKVTRRDSGSITYFRVRLGPFAKFDDMNNARQRLSDGGIDTAVIRFTKQ